VLVSASPGLADDDERAARLASDEKLARAVERDGVERFVESWLAQPMFGTVPADAPGLADRRALTAAFLAHCLRVLGTGAMTPLWDRLHELRMPIALVTGRADAKFDDIAARMVDRFQSGVVERVRLAGGHAVPLERPAELGDAIAAFIAQHVHT
jgi:2-succinyl-6-hydroxy-2,4-cyclohexadiene-1-carboxylate synthase